VTDHNAYIEGADLGVARFVPDHTRELTYTVKLIVTLLSTGGAEPFPLTSPIDSDPSAIPAIFSAYRPPSAEIDAVGYDEQGSNANEATPNQLSQIDAQVLFSTPVDLNGSDSIDPTAGAAGGLEYLWEVISEPDGNVVEAFSEAIVASPHVTVELPILGSIIIEDASRVAPLNAILSQQPFQIDTEVVGEALTPTGNPLVFTTANTDLIPPGITLDTGVTSLPETVYIGVVPASKDAEAVVTPFIGEALVQVGSDPLVWSVPGPINVNTETVYDDGTPLDAAPAQTVESIVGEIPTQLPPVAVTQAILVADETNVPGVVGTPSAAPVFNEETQQFEEGIYDEETGELIGVVPNVEGFGDIGNNLHFLAPDSHLVVDSETIYEEGVALIKNTDYTIDYVIGKVIFLRDAIADPPPTDIRADYTYDAFEWQLVSTDVQPGSEVVTTDAGPLTLGIDYNIDYIAGELVFAVSPTNPVVDYDYVNTPVPGYSIDYITGVVTFAVEPVNPTMDFTKTLFDNADYIINYTTGTVVFSSVPTAAVFIDYTYKEFYSSEYSVDYGTGTVTILVAFNPGTTNIVYRNEKTGVGLGEEFSDVADSLAAITTFSPSKPGSYLVRLKVNYVNTPGLYGDAALMLINAQEAPEAVA